MRFIRLTVTACLIAFMLAAAATVHGQVFPASTGTAHSHTTGATITITVPESNKFAYITAIDISNCQGAAAVTPAAPTYITTTNLTGAPQYQVGSGPATAGTCSQTSIINFATPLKSTTAGTNVTFVLPAFITNQVLSVNVYFFFGL